jgi:hypothetical protein
MLPHLFPQPTTPPQLEPCPMEKDSGDDALPGDEYVDRDDIVARFEYLVGLAVDSNCWKEGMGIAFSLCKFLKMLDIRIVDSKTQWFAELCAGIACNETIEELHLVFDVGGGGHIDAFRFLAPFFQNNSSLRSIDVANHSNAGRLVTKLGSLSSALKGRKNSRLQKIDINWGPAGTDEEMEALVAFFHTLQNSASVLETLLINSVDLEDITEEEWCILSHALCDRATIGKTYTSNHTFHTCTLFEEIETYDSCSLQELSILLDLNGNPNKAEVARQKIMKSHFSCGNLGIHAIACMHKSVLPHAIESRHEDYWPSFCGPQLAALSAYTPRNYCAWWGWAGGVGLRSLS